MLDELTIVNAALASIGQSPVASVDTAFPTAKRAKATMDRINTDFQAEGWWFNQYNVCLSQNDIGEVVVPSGTVTFASDDPRYVQRGGKLFDTQTRLNYIGKDVAGRLLEQISLEDMPTIAAVSLKAAVVYVFFLESNGLEPKLSNYRALAEQARGVLEAENLKHAHVNFFERVGTAGTVAVAAGRRVR